MIDSPTLAPDHPDRRQECAAAMASVVRTLEEEGHLLGWKRSEVLTALCDAADNRLSLLMEDDAAAGGIS